MKPTTHTKSKLALIALAAFGATAFAASNADASHYRRVMPNRYQRAKLHAMQTQYVKQVMLDFRKLDKDNDGVISMRDAYTPTPYRWQHVGRTWKRVPLHGPIAPSTYTGAIHLADHNKDGVISQREYRAQRLYGWKLRLRESNPRLMRGVLIRNPAIYLANAPKVRPRYAMRTRSPWQLGY